MTDPLFHVFIERARSTAPGAAAELARAIAARYGIPAAELEKRFAMGRFRVKGNVDRATADSYLADLASLGAVCTIVAANAAAPPVAAVPPAPVVAPPVMTLPAQPRVPAPAPTARAMEDSLGALSGEHPLTLSTLDGASEDEARSSRKIAIAPRESAQAASREPSREAPLPASFGPPSESSDPGRDAARSSSRSIAEPIEFTEGAAFDPFAPPELQSEAPELTLAVERKPRVSNAPPPPEPEVAPDAAGRGGKAGTLAPEPRGSMSASVPLPAAPAPRATGAPAGLHPALRDPGSRYVIGVVLAVALGAVPALLVASAREHGAFTRLDAELERTQDQADTPDEWDRLDRTRASILSRKQDERQNIVITSLLLWAVISGGLAWLWFRGIDWDRRTR